MRWLGSCPHPHWHFTHRDFPRHVTHGEATVDQKYESSPLCPTVFQGLAGTGAVHRDVWRNSHLTVHSGHEFLDGPEAGFEDTMSFGEVARQ